MLDGRSVTTPLQWERERRPELKAIFQHYMYGDIPKAVPMKTMTHAVHRDFLDGKATLKIISLDAGRGGPVIDLMLVVPNNRPGPAPVFLAMNFCGNHALTADPRVPLSRGWLYNSCKGCTNNLATEAARGGQAQDWPLARLVERGYALASFCTTDIDSDRKEVSDGIYAWLAGGDPAMNNPTNRGSIAAWAWGFHRCVDYLVTDRDVDANRIAAVGHSRNGKTALLAAAYDPSSGFFYDVRWRTGERVTDRPTLAAAAPLYFGLASAAQGRAVAARMERDFLKPGGFVTTLIASGQQWDAPNGWPPLQWLTIEGVRRYGRTDLADLARDRWIALNRRTYRNTGKMTEKYDVVDANRPAGGGEYPTQDGFGWSNGVALALLAPSRRP
jgi:hypothetical protein